MQLCTHPCPCPSGEKHHFRSSLSRPMPQPLHVCNIHDWVSFDGTSPRLGPTLRLPVLARFCVPNFRPSIRDRITSTSKIPGTGTHRWHATEENGVFVALDLIMMPVTHARAHRETASPGIDGGSNNQVMFAHTRLLMPPRGPDNLSSRGLCVAQTTSPRTRGSCLMIS